MSSFFQHILILFVIIIGFCTINIQSTTIESKHQKDIKNIDVIQLNVGGETMMTTRETLTRIQKSILSIMFNGRWEHKLQVDKKGNIFLDFNPILFRHLLNQLQILDTNKPIHFYPPLEPSLVQPFKKMLTKLGLNQLLSLEKNIISINVGGQIITNRHTTFTNVYNNTFNISLSSSSKNTKINNSTNIFLDFDPKLFRNLINQLRKKESLKNISKFNVSSYNETNSFKRVTNDLNAHQQIRLFTNNTKWKQNGITIAGGNGEGKQLNQLHNPAAIYIDDDNQRIYIADSNNHRILEWKFGANSGTVVAGGNGVGDDSDQLRFPIDVIVDKKNDSLIICDSSNKRVVRWSRGNVTDGQIIMSNISCSRLIMDNNGDLYVFEFGRYELKRWKIGETNYTVVARIRYPQYNPHFIFVDQDQSVYISDTNCHCVQKWIKGAKEGIIVAARQGVGKSLRHLFYPAGLIVDNLGIVYVADSSNNRIVRWSQGSREGSIVVGGNGLGNQPNQFYSPKSLLFDQEGNLYVVDYYNQRVQKFEVDLN